jgi:hypothetical protein
MIQFLGPQRFDPTVASAATSRGLSGPFAAVTAGWQEREAEDDELHEHLGGSLVNLALYRRGERVFRVDPELFEALRERQDRLKHLQELYRVRLDHALGAARELLHRDDEPELLLPEREAAFDAVRALDDHHLGRIREVHAEFERRWRPDEREAVARERQEIAAALDGAGTVLLAGGHVMVLLNRMRLFGLAELLAGRPVIAWSAGAMAASDRVVLFHDSPPQGAGNAEVVENGLGLLPGVVPLPHASSRLRLDDPVRVALLARRFEPARCVALDRGSRLDWGKGVLSGGPGTMRLAGHGRLEAMEVAA